MWWLIALATWSMACTLAAEYVAWRKGRPMVEGFLLGLVLGPIGALVVALLPGDDPVPAETCEHRPPSPRITALACLARAAETEEVEVDPTTWRQGRWVSDALSQEVGERRARRRRRS